MTTLPFKSTFQQLQKADIVAGKIFGNADHIRAQNMNGVDYALGLGARIVFVTAAAVLLQLMMAIIITSLNVPLFSGIAVLGWAFAVYYLAGAILPNNAHFQLVMVFAYGLLPIAVLYGFMTVPDLTVAEVMQVLSEGIFPMLFGVLFGTQVIHWMVKFIAAAFAEDESEEQQKARKAYRKAKDAFLKTHINAEERVALKRIMGIGLGLAAGMVIPLVAAIPLGLKELWAGVAACLLSLTCIVLIFVAASREEQIKKQMFARFSAEGIIAPDPAAFGVVKKAPSELERRLQLLFTKGGDQRV